MLILKSLRKADDSDLLIVQYKLYKNCESNIRHSHVDKAFVIFC